MKKLFLTLIILVALLLIAAIALPVFYKSKIVALVKTEINNNVNASVNFSEDIELSLIKSFPNFTLGINNLSVVGMNEFDGDTLVAMDKLETVIDIMTVIKGEPIGIKKIALVTPRIHALVLSNGKANWDIAKPISDSTAAATDTAATKFHVKLKKLEITNGFLVYDDKTMGVNTKLEGFDYDMAGDFTQDDFLLQIKSTIKQWDMTYGGIKYLNKVNTNINVDMNMNMPNMKFTFSNNTFKLNELNFNFDGFVQMLNDDIVMDIRYDAPNNSFKNFLSLVPGMYTKDFANLKTSGTLGFNGTAKGTYNEKSLPAFNLNLLVANAMFQHPTLPVPVKDVQINLNVANKDGNLNNTIVNLSKFHMDIAGDAFDAKLIAKDIMQDPHIDSWLKGRINLDNISKIVPLENGMEIHGIITSDVTAIGKISDIEKQQFEKFNATGQIATQNIKFKSADLPLGFNSNEALLVFNPKTVALKTFDAQLGKSDFKLNGEISNFFPYLFSNGIIEGQLNLSSTQIDANQFLSNEPETAAPKAEDTTAMEAPEIPANIDFTFTGHVGKLLYANMEISNFGGSIKLKNQQLNFENVALNTLGAAIKMNGFYETTNHLKPTTNIDFSIENLDMQLAAKTFNSIKKIAPIIEKSHGSFSTTLSLVTTLDKHLNPVYTTLFANGVCKIMNAEIKEVKVLDEVAKALKNDTYKTLNLQNVTVKYKVENGRVYTEPFNVAVVGKTLTLSGSSGLDQTIDYTGTTQVQRGELGKINAALENSLNSLNNKLGSNLTTSQNLNLGISIKGTFSKPIITTNLADLAKQEANSLKDQAKAELEKQKKLLEEKAKAEAERLKQEAQVKAKAEIDKAKQQAQAEADKLKAAAEKAKAEAEAKATAEKERLKKQAEEEAKKKLKGLLKR
jgi:uncharacterized protein involved in outer membrane biogenesis